MSPILIGVLMIAVVFAIAAAVMIPAYFRQRIPWKPLPGVPNVQYHSPGPVDEAKLARCFLAAIAALRVHADFSARAIDHLSNVRIFVEQGDTWHTTGAAKGEQVYIGTNFAALAHELAHVAEFVEGSIDLAHASWGRRGIFIAIDTYELRRQEAVTQTT